MDAAYDYLLRSEAVDELGIRYEVSVSPSGGGGGKQAPRGIYLRQGYESSGPASFTVTVTPALHQDVANLDR